jgi:hypothetical protein
LNILKGVCPYQFDRYLYFEYYIYGLKNGYPWFVGFEKSQIYFNTSLEAWILQSFEDPDMTLEAQESMEDDLPIGRQNWKIGKSFKRCNHKSGNNIKLTLSTCYPDHFTCNSGLCLLLPFRCDFFNDCQDQSDELDCHFLMKPSTYSKSILPMEDRKPVQVFINVLILAFPDISTLSQKFTVDFYLELSWTDHRLKFENLQDFSSLNALSEEGKQSLWSPKLLFVNGLGPFQTVVDTMTTATIIKSKKHDETMIESHSSEATEARIFKGDENRLKFRKEYYLDYSCQFNLHHYPFDTQFCRMEFAVHGRTDLFVQLKKHTGEHGVQIIGKQGLILLNTEQETQGIIFPNPGN